LRGLHSSIERSPKSPWFRPKTDLGVASVVSVGMRRKCASLNITVWSTHSRRIEPISQYALNALRCQRMMVAGLTIRIALRTEGKSRYSHTRNHHHSKMSETRRGFVFDKLRQDIVHHP
jgi:hypothetical protein